MHYADLFEAVADALGDRDALVCGIRRRSWREFENRSARLAQALTGAGVRPGSKVALYLYNCNEYAEAYMAALKCRAAAVNVNYRYIDKELKYLLEYSDAEVLIYHSSLGARVAGVVSDLPQIRLLVEVDDGGEPLSMPGAQRYEELVARHLPAARIMRSDEDEFMIFTGGTTGLPKGVVYRMGDVANYTLAGLPAFFGLDVQLRTVDDLVVLVRRLASVEPGPASMPACPLAHTAGLVNGLLTQMVLGARIVMLPSRSFDAVSMLETIERERVTFTVIVGDAFCLPILRALDEAKARGRIYDLSTLRIVMSSGVAWSPESKRRLLEYADLQLIDAMGATEGGMGLSISSRRTPPEETGRFGKMPATKVFTEDGREVQPGSGEIGHIAAGGMLVPVAYFKDPEKSARTFRVIGGERYAFIGDMGTIEADGSLRVLGRGSGCINTAGEKVFPEEVEGVLMAHPEVDDCLVLGAPHERFGQCVAAIVATRDPREGLVQSINEHCRQNLAAYKCPRIIELRDRVERGPHGKADYGWARRELGL